MGFTSVLAQAHKLIDASVRPGDIVIDATVGTGADTAFLAEKIAPNGRVYGFDIQEEAINQAKMKLAQRGLADHVTWLLHSHAEMDQHLPLSAKGQVAAAAFNLGFLPGGSDQQIITQTETTLRALSLSLEWIRPGGVITVVAYPGHPGGDEEAESVRAWAKALPASAWQVLCYEFINQTNRPPFLIAVTKKKARPSQQ